MQLGTRDLKIREILDLKKGDVILLDTKVNGKLQIEVGGKEKFLGYPGIVGKKKAVKITNILTENGK